MAHMKLIERSATVSFCPGSGLLAAGTVAEAIDMSFSTNSVLEVFALDFASHSETLPVLGSVQAPERFNRLAWGSKLTTDPAFPQLGLLAGGLADGSVCVWDPSAIVAKAEGRPALLAKMQKHSGAVKGLEFNTFSPNLLASGAADSDLCIWDLAKPATPSLYPALKGAAGAPAAGNDITYIAWNRKVQHILASSCSNGSTVVWDLKRQKPVISFRDPNSHRRASMIQWNPEVATQLVVASDDDRSPTLQMWDLRNSVSPLKEFVGHTKGVLGMSWSHHDVTLLLSSGKDNRTICWDVQTADILCELPASGNWNFDVQWCPTAPGVFSTASFDGHVGLHNLHACTGAKVVETVNADFTVTQQATGDVQPLKKAPAWMRRPCGATFGFGGKLVSFANHKVQGVDAAGQPVVREHGTVSISQVVTEGELVSRSEAFEHAIAGGEKGTLQRYCASKAQAFSPTSEESEVWSYLSLLFEADGRRELLRRLGYEDILAKEAAAQAQANGLDALASGVSAVSIGAEAVHAPSPVGAGGAPEDFFAQADDPDFFDKLPDKDIAPESPAPADGPVTSAGGAAPPAAAQRAHGSAGGHSEGGAAAAAGLVDASMELEEEVVRAMVAGNYEVAVESCFKANRLADALLIANIFNSDLFKRTMHRYMARCPKPYMAIVKANVDGDFEALVKTRPVGQWRETLALLATYTAQEDWATMCDALASRLAAAGMHHAASLCYVCAGNVDAAVMYWSKAAAGAGGAAAAGVEVLQNVIEKAVIMGLATGSKKASTSLSELITSYASVLAAQGRMSTALEYLEYVPGEASTTVAVLKDRIYRSGAAQPPHGTHPPPFPFILEDVHPAVDQAQMQRQQQQHAAAAGRPSAGAAGAYGQAAAGAYGQAAAGGYGQAAQAAAGAYGAQQQQQAAWGQAAPAAQAQYGQAAQAQAARYAAGAYAGAAAAQPQQHQQQQANMYQQQQQQQHYAPQPAQAAAPQSSYNAYPSYQPTTTSAAPSIYQQQQAAAAPQQAAPAAAGAYQQSMYQQQHAAPPQQQPAYTEPAAPVYQIVKRAGGSGAGAAGAAAPAAAPNMYQPSAAVPAPAAPAAPTSTAPSAYMPMQPAAPASTVQAAPAPSYFMPTTTPGAPMQPAAAPAPVGPPQGYAAAAGGAHAPHGAMPGMPAPPAAPASQRPAAPPAPAGPPANITISSADTSKVPAAQQPVVASLNGLFNSCVPLANNPAKKREMDDNSRKLGQLLWRLNAGDVSEGVVPKLVQLCAAIDAADWHTANHIQVQMTTTDWDECGFWLSAVKRLVKMRQQGAGM